MSGLGGEVTVTVDCDVIQADGGTRTAAITGAWLALYDALTVWKAAGKITDDPADRASSRPPASGMVDGELLLDLEYAEDSIAEVDMNVIMDGSGRFIEIQGTGEQTPFDRARLDAMLDLAAGGVDSLLAIQSRIIEEDLDVFES